jgi:hypothetical protein
MSLRPPSSPSPGPSPVQGANGKNASARASMGPAARPTAAAQGFSLASPRPGGGPPSGRPTSELLGSATFQTPEGEPSPPVIFFCSSPALRPFAFFPADAIDQWFENFHHYEVTLVSIFDHLSRHQINTANAAIFSRRKRWLLPLSTSILRRNSVPSSNVS